MNLRVVIEPDEDVFRSIALNCLVGNLWRDRGNRPEKTFQRRYNFI